MKTMTYVGLDVHSTSIAVAVLGVTDQTPQVFEIPNEPKAIRRTITRLKSSARAVRCCYEAGPCGFEVYRQLEELGVPCSVIAPALIPRKPGDRIKTDHRDATKLARLFRAGELTAIRVPTPDEEAVRDLVRAREDIRRDLNAARHRLGKFLLRHGRIYRDGKQWTERHWHWIQEQVFEHVAARTTFEHYQIQVHHLDQRRSAIEEEIVALAETKPYRPAVARLSCLRGIKTLTAMVLLTEVQDFRRFERPRQLMGFLGLVPSEHSSGRKQQRGGITKAGNSHARRVLVEAAWSYRHRPKLGPRTKKLLTGQPPPVIAQVTKANHRLHRRWNRLTGRSKRSQVVVTAVARELCGFVWALMAKEPLPAA
jgi:transposase